MYLESLSKNQKNGIRSSTSYSLTLKRHLTQLTEIACGVLKYYGIPEKIVDMIIALYKESECCVKTENGTTRFFNIMSGFHQGRVLFPMLFIIIMDYALRLASGYGVKISNKQLFDLDLADDVVLLEESKERLQQLLDTITENAENVGLKINIDKSKSMAITSSPLVLHCKNKDLD